MSEGGDSQETASVKLTAAVLWLASLAALVASYEGIMMSTLVVGVPPNGQDMTAPFVLGLTEFALFAVLVPVEGAAGAADPSTAAQLRHLTWWPVVFALESAITYATIVNCKRQVRRTVRGAPSDVAALLDWYSGVLKQGQVAIGVVTVVVLAAFVALHCGPVGLRSWQWIVGAGVLVGEVGGIVSQEQARHVVTGAVSGGRSELADGFAT